MRGVRLGQISPFVMAYGTATINQGEEGWTWEAWAGRFGIIIVLFSWTSCPGSLAGIVALGELTGWILAISNAIFWVLKVLVERLDRDSFR